MFQAIFTMDNHSVKTCHMPQEYTIIFIYLIYIIIILVKILNIKYYYWCVYLKHFIKKKYKYIFCHKKSNN